MVQKYALRCWKISLYIVIAVFALQYFMISVIFYDKFTKKSELSSSICIIVYGAISTAIVCAAELGLVLLFKKTIAALPFIISIIILFNLAELGPYTARNSIIVYAVRNTYFPTVVKKAQDISNIILLATNICFYAVLIAQISCNIKETKHNKQISNMKLGVSSLSIDGNYSDSVINIQSNENSEEIKSLVNTTSSPADSIKSPDFINAIENGLLMPSLQTKTLTKKRDNVLNNKDNEIKVESDKNAINCKEIHIENEFDERVNNSTHKIEIKSNKIFETQYNNFISKRITNNIKKIPITLTDLVDKIKKMIYLVTSVLLALCFIMIIVESTYNTFSNNENLLKQRYQIPIFILKLLNYLLVIIAQFMISLENETYLYKMTVANLPILFKIIVSLIRYGSYTIVSIAIILEMVFINVDTYAIHWVSYLLRTAGFIGIISTLAKNPPIKQNISESLQCKQTHIEKKENCKLNNESINISEKNKRINGDEAFDVVQMQIEPPRYVDSDYEKGINIDYVIIPNIAENNIINAPPTIQITENKF